MKEITGKVLKLGDNVDTTQIIPRQYHNTTSVTKLAKHLLEEYGNGFPAKIRGGEILVAGSHFGSGPTSLQTALALKAGGISCIVAKSFDRSFFRSGINHGLPLVVADIVDKVKDGDEIAIDLGQGTITYPGGEDGFPPYPEFILSIVHTGDLITAVKKKLEKV